ncbi:MAG: TatD family hydrolase [Candidatus Hodarchaeota archaeon]
MNLIDSHAHIIPPWFKKGEDIRNVSERAHEQGIQYVVNCAIDPAKYDFVINLAKIDKVFPVTLGLSPSWIERINIDSAFKGMEKWSKEIVGIGEIGLDYHWIKDPKVRKKQEEFFIRAIQLANTQNKPIVIHSRKAEQECIDILKKYSETGVILHCFAGTVGQGMEAVDHGWIISIPTAVTNRRKHRALAQTLPLESLIIETDSPFLTPTPHFPPKTRNEPAFVVHAARTISELKDIPLKDVATATVKTTKKIFRLE